MHIDIFTRMVDNQERGHAIAVLIERDVRGAFSDVNFHIDGTEPVFQFQEIVEFNTGGKLRVG